MGGDKGRLDAIYNTFKLNGRTDFPSHYIYYKDSKGLYRYTPNSSGIFIRKINSIFDLMKIFKLK